MKYFIHLVYFVWAQFAWSFGLFQVCVAIDEGAPTSVVVFGGLIAALGVVACAALILTVPTEKEESL